MAEEKQTEQMTGIVTELARYVGHERVESEIVFAPDCDWWMKDAGDYLAMTTYTDFEAFIAEFGHDVAKQVTEGEIVKVTRAAPDYLEHRGCEKKGKFIKVMLPIHGHRDSIKGYQEHLTREHRP